MEKPLKHLLHIKHVLLLVSVYALTTAARAQEREDKSLFNKLLPSQYTLQYAGSMGFLSIGAGYANRSDNLNFSLHYGHVPEKAGGKLDIVTARFVGKPFRTRVTQNTSWTPFNPVAFVSYTLNEGFYTSWPAERYPKDYYWWSSAFRLHAGVNSELTFLSAPSAKMVKSYACYVELNTNDLYIASYMNNRKFLSLWDILRIGAGVKVNLR
jgi:hypothetical protein